MEKAKQVFGIVIPSILNNDPVTPRVPTLLNWTYPSLRKGLSLTTNMYHMAALYPTVS